MTLAIAAILIRAGNKNKPMSLMLKPAAGVMCIVVISLSVINMLHDDTIESSCNSARIEEFRRQSKCVFTDKELIKKTNIVFLFSDSESEDSMNKIIKNFINDSNSESKNIKSIKTPIINLKPDGQRFLNEINQIKTHDSLIISYIGYPDINIHSQTTEYLIKANSKYLVVNSLTNEIDTSLVKSGLFYFCIDNYEGDFILLNNENIEYLTEKWPIRFTHN
ncbi:MAG: hypothetical protein RL095_1981 [Verrucomicrobiota bacterium]